MQSMVVAINVANSDDIVSNVGDVFSYAEKDNRISDVVMFLPSLSFNVSNILEMIAEYGSSCCPSVKMHIVIEEEDRGVLPFNHVCVLKEKYSNVFISSKDGELLIGEQVFSYFSLDKFLPSEIDDFLNDLYNSEKSPYVKRCFAIATDEDRSFLNDVFANAVFLKKGEVNVFLSRQLNDSDTYFNIKQSVERNLNNNIFIKDLKRVESEQLRILYNDSSNEKEGPLLVKTNKSKKGNR